MSQASGFCSLDIATPIQGLSTNSHAVSARCHANQTRKPSPAARATPGDHTKCINMPDPVYRGHTSNVSWICFSCGIPYFSTTLFETNMADSIATSVRTENSYSILSSNADIQTESSSITKIVSEYDQEIPQSQTADNPVAPRGRAAQPSRDTRKTN